VEEGVRVVGEEQKEEQKVSEEQELKEYRQGDIVSLMVELRDDTGVYFAMAVAFLLVDGEPDEDEPRHSVELTGSPDGTPTQAEVILRGELQQEPPGVYACYAVVAENVYHALTRYELDPPRPFRIVEHPDDVREGPEVLSVGTFW
jgi:hypothetical protein